MSLVLCCRECALGMNFCPVLRDVAWALCDFILQLESIMLARPGLSGSDIKACAYVSSASLATSEQSPCE